MLNITEIFTIAGLVSLITLFFMELVLGIDNIVFISILCGRLPVHEQRKARRIGLGLALIMRILLLFGIGWLVRLNNPLIEMGGLSMSARDIILFCGGLFLMAKSTTEIHGKIQGSEEGHKTKTALLSLGKAVVQIILLDIVFSFDSILTAVGLVDNVLIMILAVIFSMIAMLIFSAYISDFVNRHPTVKMLALSFLLMIGLLLVVEGFHVHVPRGYVYFAMAFSFAVEMLNLKIRGQK